MKLARRLLIKVGGRPEEKSEGRVVDAMTGDPIEGAKVILPSGEYGITGTDGRVTVWHKNQKRGKRKFNATP